MTTDTPELIHPPRTTQRLRTLAALSLLPHLQTRPHREFRVIASDDVELFRTVSPETAAHHLDTLAHGHRVQVRVINSADDWTDVAYIDLSPARPVEASWWADGPGSVILGALAVIGSATVTIAAALHLAGWL